MDRRGVIILLAVVAGFSGSAHAQAAAAAPEATESVVLGDAHSFALRDPDTQVPYRLYVALPPGYATSTAPYPVLYMLDAEAGFALATQAARLLAVDSVVPELILVGIGYDLPGAARRALRIRHYTPTPMAFDSTSGQGATFLSSMVQTIIPAIESRYRTAPGDRALFGHSLGGLFVLYTLVERPETFRRYIASSPSLWWDEGALLRLERQRARPGSTLEKTLFMSVGAEEAADMTQLFQPFADSLASRHYQGFTLTATVLPEETHLGAFIAGLSRGMRVVFR